MPKTYAEQLAEVESAITAISERGQEYWIGDRRLKRGDLEALYRERTSLTKKAAREAAGGVRTRYGTPQ